MILSTTQSPRNTLYFVAAMLLEHTKGQALPCTTQELCALMLRRHGIKPRLTILAMDWLYLLGAPTVEDSGQEQHK